jgi:hypothetical protein
VEIKGGKIAGNRISVEVYRFMKYAVFAVDPATSEPEIEQPKNMDTEVEFSDIGGHWAKASIEKAVLRGDLRMKSYLPAMY